MLEKDFSAIMVSWWSYKWYRVTLIPSKSPPMPERDFPAIMVFGGAMNGIVLL